VNGRRQSTEYGVHADCILRGDRASRPDADVDGAQSPVQEQLPGRRDVHLHVLDARRRETSGTHRARQNNQFDYLTGEYGNSTDLQDHTLRLWTLYRFPVRISASLSYFYGSGQRFAAAIAGRRTASQAPTV
jgi:hypothetical protein